MRGIANPVLRRFESGLVLQFRGPMYQGGDDALQALCGRFDSDGLHQN